jgi:hypothetical protein
VVTRTSFTSLDDTGEAQQRAWSPLVCAQQPTGRAVGAGAYGGGPRSRVPADRQATSELRRAVGGLDHPPDELRLAFGVGGAVLTYLVGEAQLQLGVGHDQLGPRSQLVAEDQVLAFPGGATLAHMDVHGSRLPWW